MKNLTPKEEKAVKAVAKQALKQVQPGMVVGLGTGRSASIFIEELLIRTKNENLQITCVATSLKTREMIEGKLPLIDESLDVTIDITFDGADRADCEKFCLIKGGGGALLREKLVASRSKKNIILVDESKIACPLFGFPLPVEIVTFGYQSTIERLEGLGFTGTLRKKDDSSEIALSDNQNYIFDIKLESPIVEPSATHKILKQTLGVIETGLFCDTTTEIYVGQLDGSVKKLEK